MGQRAWCQEARTCGEGVCRARPTASEKRGSPGACTAGSIAVRGARHRSVSPGDTRRPYQRRRLAAADRALSARRQARDAAIAERLGFPTIEAWYGARRAASATGREMMAEAGMCAKWLRRLARDWRAQHVC
jgi:hypothetical protein